MIFNTGGMFTPLIPSIGKDKLNNINGIDDYVLETINSSPNKSLQFEAIKQLRKQLEIRDIIKDENNKDWSFVPKHP